jgi:hypothetical protein
VRAFVCGGGDEHAGEKGKAEEEGQTNGQGGNGDAKGKRREEEEPQTHFGIFATRALKQGEEIVVGWEWDDGNAVHRVGEVAGLEGCAFLFYFIFLRNVLSSTFFSLKTALLSSSKDHLHG